MILTSSSAASKKRRFQPPASANPITNYFTSSGSQSGGASPSHVSYDNYSAPTFSPSPALSGKVQSSLLNVGMRVRKAVPEGYQTITKESKLDAYIHRAIQNPSDDTEINASSAELAPFCGMFKVGNLATQTFPHPPTAAERGVKVGWDDNALPSSQESTDSASSIPPPNSHKRGLDADSDYEGEQYDMAIPFPHQQAHAHSRAILTPKLGQKGGRMAFKPAKMSREQENRDPLGSSVADFEEAVFLCRREEVDEESKEVEMSGV